MGSEIRLYQKEDYQTVSRWWQSHGWNPIPQNILPPLGVIAGGNAAAGWLYMDNGGTGVCMMEWLVSNPDVRPRDALLGISAVVEFLKSEAKRMDYSVMLSTCKQASLARALERAGFQRTDSDMIHLLASL